MLQTDGDLRERNGEFQMGHSANAGWLIVGGQRSKGVPCLYNRQSRSTILPMMKRLLKKFGKDKKPKLPSLTITNALGSSEPTTSASTIVKRTVDLAVDPTQAGMPSIFTTAPASPQAIQVVTSATVSVQFSTSYGVITHRRSGAWTPNLHFWVRFCKYRSHVICSHQCYEYKQSSYWGLCCYCECLT